MWPFKPKWLLLDLGSSACFSLSIHGVQQKSAERKLILQLGMKA